MDLLDASPAYLIGKQKLFDGTNYESWKLDTEILLYEKSLFGFIDESEIILDPGKADAEKVNEQIRRKQRAYGIIYRSLDDKQKLLIQSTRDPKQAWLTIKSVCEPTSIAKISDLRHKFYQCRMLNGESVNIFTSRLDKIVADLRAMNREVKDDEVAFQMIAHLPAAYEFVVQGIFQWDLPKFTTANVKSALQTEEIRLTAKDQASNSPQDLLVSSITRTGKQTPLDKRKCFRCQVVGHIAKYCPTRQVKGPHQKHDGKTQKKAQMFIKGQNLTSNCAQAAKSATEDGFVMNSFICELYNSQVFDGQDSFILDSGASDHFCKDERYFCEYKAIHPTNVKQGSGFTQAIGIGTVKLSVMSDDGREVFLCLNKVYHVPNMSRNLISIPVIDQCGYTLKISNGVMSLFMKDGALMLIVKRVGKLYQVKATVLGENDNAQELICFESSLVWHKRFAHYGMNNIHRLWKDNLVRGLPKVETDIGVCEICQHSKSTRGSYASESKRVTKFPGQLVYSDIWGPSPVPSNSGMQYVILFVDDYSGYVCIAILKSKSDAYEAFVQFCKDFQKKFGYNIHTLRTDNGGEFCSMRMQAFLKERNIKHEFTNAYSPEEDGKVERVNRTLLEGIRALLFEVKAPLRFWAEAAMMYIHVYNRIVHGQNRRQTSFELWHGYKPTVKYFRKFGSVVYAHIAKQKRHKLQPRVWKGILVGYATNRCGYRVYDPVQHHVIETRHVKVDESKSGFELLKSMNEVYDFFRLVYNQNEQYEEVDSSVIMKQEHSSSHQESSETDASSEEEEFKVDDQMDGNNPQTGSRNPLKIEFRQKLVVRKSGKTAGKVDTYYYPIENGQLGSRLRSIWDVKKYCKKKDILFEPDKFDFSHKRSEQLESSRPTATVTVQQDDKGETSQMEANQGLVDSEMVDSPACYRMEIPLTYKDAMASENAEHWHAAMKEELLVMQEREVWEVVRRPESASVLPSKWVFVKKVDMKGTVKRFKARLVAGGHRQVHGLNWDESYSPVVQFNVIKLFFVILVVLLGWIDHQLDINSAYLYSPLSEAIYLEQPEGFVTNNAAKLVLRLRRAIYGLKQAGRAWHQYLHDELIGLGFVNLTWTNCVYRFNWDTIICIYVDDIAVFSRNKECLDKALGIIKLKFDCVILGQIGTLLGVNFIRKAQGIFLSQSDYIEAIVARFNVIAQFPVYVPMKFGITLSCADCPNDVEGKSLMTKFPYRELIGSLLYLAYRTRPDILFTVTLLSQYCSNPGMKHWEALCDLLRYVNTTKCLLLNMSVNPSMKLSFYVDASWANDIDTRRSFGGYIWFIGNIPIGWSCKRQRCVARSSTEAEYIAMDMTACEILWLYRLINECGELGVGFSVPIMFCDNQSAMYYLKNGIENNRTKHIDVKFHFIRELYHSSKFVLQYVQTQSNVADMLTKALVKKDLTRHLESFMHYL